MAISFNDNNDESLRDYIENMTQWSRDSIMGESVDETNKLTFIKESLNDFKENEMKEIITVLLFTSCGKSSLFKDHILFVYVLNPQ